jgi:hypothetical protein
MVSGKKSKNRRYFPGKTGTDYFIAIKQSERILHKISACIMIFIGKHVFCAERRRFTGKGVLLWQTAKR